MSRILVLNSSGPSQEREWLHHCCALPRIKSEQNVSAHAAGRCRKMQEVDIGCKGTTASPSEVRIDTSPDPSAFRSNAVVCCSCIHLISFDFICQLHSIVFNCMQLSILCAPLHIRPWLFPSSECTAPTISTRSTRQPDPARNIALAVQTHWHVSPALPHCPTLASSFGASGASNCSMLSCVGIFPAYHWGSGCLIGTGTLRKTR